MGRKKKKVICKQNIFAIFTFTLVFGIACFEAYSHTKGKVIKSDRTPAITNANNSSNNSETSYFGDFAGKMMGYLDEENEEQLGLKGTLNNFAVRYPSKDKLSENVLTADGEIDIVMNSLQDLDLCIDLEAKYNSKPLDLALAFVDTDAYFAIDDFRIKSTYSKSLDILNYVFDCFFDPENEEGLGIDLDLESVVDGLVGNIDLSGLDLSALNTTETDAGENVIIGLDISEVSLDITVRKTDLALVKVDLGTLKVGDATITGAIDFDVIDKVLKLDDPLYPKQRGQFVEAISYIGWADDLLDLFQTRSLGLDLSAQVSLIDGDDKTLLADVASKIDLNCADVFDFNNLNIPELIEDISQSSFDVSSLFNLDKLEFGVDLETRGQQDEVYAGINLSYFDNAAYLSLNENADSAVMRAKINNETLSQLLDSTPNLVSAIEGLSEELPEDDIEEASDEIFAFITDSALVKGIKNNDFSGILDVLKSIRNDDNKIYLDLDLSPLGLGNNAEVNLVLNSSREEGQKVLSIDVKNVVISSVEINVNVKSSDFDGTRIGQVKAKKDAYDDLSFLPGIINQTSDILNEKTGKLTISGAIVDENNEGINIDGVAQFDANAKVGYGSINLREHSSKIVNSNKYIDHTIDFDVDNSAENNSDRNALFVYNSELKAKFTLQTFVDIIDLVKELINSDDERFTKFGDLLSESLLSGVLNEIIDSKDYLRLAKSSIIKSIRQENGGSLLRVVVSGEILGMDDDMNIVVNFNGEGANRKLSSLAISGLKLSEKNIALEIGLDDFDESYKSPVNKAANFMDFSQVRVLLDFGINTTKINYYHLTAKAKIKLSVLSLITVDLDFHIHVDGKKTRVYGTIPNVPWLSDIASGHLGTADVSSELVFEPTEDIGGVFHIVRNEDYLLSKDKVYYWRSTSDNFVENIIQYLLIDMLDIRETVSDLLTSSTVSTEKDRDPNFAKMFHGNGFAYSKNASTGVNTWDIGLNLNEILGNDTLGKLDLTLTGKDSGDSGLFTEASVELGVASILTITADIKLVNPSFAVETWPSDIEAKYNKVLNWYNNLSASNKASFDSNYMNNPLKGYTMVDKRGYF